MSKERLGVIKRIHKQIIESNKIEMETGSLAAGDVVHDHLFQLFSEKHTDWLIEQAERFEVLAEQHDEALAQNKRYRELVDKLLNPTKKISCDSGFAEYVMDVLEELEDK